MGRVEPDRKKKKKIDSTRLKSRALSSAELQSVRARAAPRVAERKKKKEVNDESFHLMLQQMYPLSFSLSSRILLEERMKMPTTLS